jgi:hypothetical protein
MIQVSAELPDFVKPMRWPFRLAYGGTAFVGQAGAQQRLKTAVMSTGRTPGTVAWVSGWMGATHEVSSHGRAAPELPKDAT